MADLATKFDIGEALKQLALEHRVSIRGTFQDAGVKARVWHFSVDGVSGDWMIW